MPLINQAIPNLIQGVSQQADVQRIDGQASEQENAISSVVDGLSKRPNTKHLAQLLTNAVGANSFVHFINRSSTERYVIFYDVTTHKLYAFNLDGTEAAIDGATGGKSISTDDYLYVTSANTELRGLTVGDSTFLLNTTQEVGIGDTVSSSLDKEALVWIKQGDYQKYYGVTLKGNFNANNTSNTLATGTITCERFAPSSWKYYRVKSVNLTSGGQLYLPSDGTLSIIPADYGQGSNWNGWRKAGFALAGAGSPGGNSGGLQLLWETPTFSYTVNASGVIQNVTVLNQGRFYRSGSGSGDSEITFNAVFSAPQGQAHYAGTNADMEIKATFQSGGSSVPGNADTSTIATGLVGNGASSTDLYDKGITATTGGTQDFSVVQSNNLIVLTREPGGDGGDFDIAGRDGLAGGGVGVAYRKVGDISDLPLYAKNGFKIEIAGSADSVADNYWVEFKTSNGQTYGEGIWEETVAPSVQTEIDNTTLPKSLTLTAENTFTLNTLNIALRNVGDETSNAYPSFVGKAINNLFLFKNRLGFLSEDSVIMSESGLGVIDNGVLKYNFFRTSVTQLLDADPIDVTVSSGRLTNLKSAVGFQENLVLFTDDAQFTLKGGNLLTPTSVSITPITNFEYNANIEPVPIGSYIYFPFTRGDKSGVREYTVNSSTDVYSAEEITEHVPAYLPSDITQMIGSSSEDVLIGFGSSEPNTLYIYSFFWNVGKKLLSSWSKFIVPFNVIGFEMIEGILYIIGTKEGTTELLSMNFQTSLTDTGATYNTYLDCRKETTLSAGTSVPLGVTASVGDTVSVWDDEGSQLYNEVLTSTKSTITLPDAHTGKVYSGIKYTMKYTFTKPHYKLATSHSKAPSGFVKAMIRNGVVFFSQTAAFDVKVQADARDEVTNSFTNLTVGASTLNALNLKDGNYRFPVFTDAEGTVISLESDSALPVRFNSAEFEMFVHQRSNRYG